MEQEAASNYRNETERVFEQVSEEYKELEEQLDTYQQQPKSKPEAALEKMRAQQKEVSQYVEALEKEMKVLKQNNSELLAQNSHSRALIAKEEADRDLQSQHAANASLEDLVRHLKNDNNAKAQKITHLENTVSELEAMWEQPCFGSAEPLTDSQDFEQEETLQSVINDLENQLETMKNSERLANKEMREVEEDLNNLKILEEELTQDKENLQFQVIDQMNQISELKSQMEELKLTTNYQMDTMRVPELCKMLETECQTHDHKVKQIEANGLADQSEEKVEQFEHINTQLPLKFEGVEQHSIELQEVFLQLQQKTTDVEQKSTGLEEKSAIVEQTMLQFEKQNADITQKSAEPTWLECESTEVVKLELKSKKQAQELQNTLRRIKALAADHTGDSIQPQFCLPAHPSCNKNTDSMMDEVGAKHQQQLTDLQSIVDRKREEIEDVHMPLQLTQARDPLQHLCDMGSPALRQEMEMLQAEVQVVEAAAVEQKRFINSEWESKASASEDRGVGKDTTIAQLTEKLTCLQEEVATVNSADMQLEQEHDSVQVQLEKHEKEVDELTKEVEGFRPEANGVSANILAHFESEIKQLFQVSKTDQSILSEKEKGLYSNIDEPLIQKQERLSKDNTDRKVKQKVIEILQVQLGDAENQITIP